MPFINSVFLSATMEDLEKERKAAIEIFTNLGVLPVSMEYFTDNGQDKLEIIKKLIGEADYFALIIGGKYGEYLYPKEKLSFTEWEYNIAKQYNKRILAFVPADLGDIPPKKTDQDEKKEERKKRLEEFIKNVKKIPLVSHYRYGDIIDLKQRIQNSFYKYGYRDKSLSRYCGKWISTIKSVSYEQQHFDAKSDEWIFYGRGNHVYGVIKRIEPIDNPRFWSFVGMEFGDQLIISFAENDQMKMSAGIMIVKKAQGIDGQMNGYYYEFAKVDSEGKPIPIPIVLNRKSLDWYSK